MTPYGLGEGELRAILKAFVVGKRAVLKAEMDAIVARQAAKKTEKTP